MPAYHSAYNELPTDQVSTIASISILPFRTKIRGPAPPPLSVTSSPDELDIIDEALDLFRANSLFRNFEIKGGADRLLIYFILFISQCLTILNNSRVPMSQNEAIKQLSTTAVDAFTLPGDAGFPLNNLYQAPANRMEAGECKYDRQSNSTCLLIFYLLLFCRPIAIIPDTS
jgi:actin related protein 2/3 complex subunit 3